MKRITAWAVLFTAFATPLALGADEDDFPAKPVRVVVPFPAAGSTDIIARRVAERLSAAMGQPFVIENKPGASGNIGAAYVAKAPADGYTILLGTSGTQSVNPHLYKDSGFDAARDFVAVSLLVRVPSLIVATPDFPARTLPALVAYAKSRTVTYGHPSVGSSKHFAAESFRLRAGVDMQAVAYKGSAPMLTDLLGGHINIAFDEPLTSMAHIRAGKLVPIAVTGPARWPTLPDVPRVAELGGALADYDVTGWFGFLVPSGTPPKIVRKLNAEIRKLFADEEFRKALFAAGAEPVGSSAEDFDAFIRIEYQRWAELIRTADIKVN